VEEDESVRQYREGVELVFKQLGDVLAKLGVVPFDALGEHFDPYRHEALIREENWDAPENTVIEVIRPGYLYKDRLLRPAQVKVAVHSRL
jgi:molecular chaperone GrpE